MVRISKFCNLGKYIILSCSLYQPAALAAATTAGVGYDVEADGRRVAKMSAVFRSVYTTMTADVKCTSAEMLFAGFASHIILSLHFTEYFCLLQPTNHHSRQATSTTIFYLVSTSQSGTRYSIHLNQFFMPLFPISNFSKHFPHTNCL